MKSIYILFLFILLSSCNASSNSNKQQQIEKGLKPAPTFQMVEIPSILTSPEERAEYLVLNYWKHFNFKDTANVNNHLVEQAFVDYIDILPHTKPEVAIESVRNTIKKAMVEKKMFNYFFSLYEKYLYDANSPMRNDEVFIEVLEETIALPSLDDSEKIRPQNLLQLVRKNRIGNPANDFSFTLKDGQKKMLYELQAEYVLLYFYNPGCYACKETFDKIKASIHIASLLQKGKLKIVAVYPDEDLTEWKKHLNDIPDNWINGYDDGSHLKEEEIYDLKAIPTLYLLDKNKQIIFKDAYFEQIDAFLAEIH
jgi:thiol-disulfide isomerase/thioredoxin